MEWLSYSGPIRQSVLTEVTKSVQIHAAAVVIAAADKPWRRRPQTAVVLAASSKSGFEGGEDQIQKRRRVAPETQSEVEAALAGLQSILHLFPRQFQPHNLSHTKLVSSQVSLTWDQGISMKWEGLTWNDMRLLIFSEKMDCKRENKINWLIVLPLLSTCGGPHLSSDTTLSVFDHCQPLQSIFNWFPRQFLQHPP